jgi:hypothetical protein
VPQSSAATPPSLRKRLSSSLGGHIVLAQVGMGLPLAALFLYQNHTEGTLTFRWALWVVFVAAAAAFAWAVMFWSTVSRPLIRKYRGSSR